MIKSDCKQCGSEIIRAGSRPGVFCNLVCKAEWQRNQKPVTRDWLYQKYIDEKLGTVEISKLVKRHPKRVYEWLVDWNIPVRKRGWKIARNAELKPYQGKEWLSKEYLDKEKSVPEIANEQGVSVGCIMHFMREFDINRRNIVEARKIKYWGLSGEQNGMYGRTGKDSGNWKGGVTPERQKLYSSQEWANAIKTVWRRDARTCQRCEKKYNPTQSIYHIHHIVPFAASRKLRTVPTNLILLCSDCHCWVHSNKNIHKDFLDE